MPRPVPSPPERPDGLIDALRRGADALEAVVMVLPGRGTEIADMRAAADEIERCHSRGFAFDVAFQLEREAIEAVQATCSHPEVVYSASDLPRCGKCGLREANLAPARFGGP